MPAGRDARDRGARRNYIFNGGDGIVTLHAQVPATERAGMTMEIIPLTNDVALSNVVVKYPVGALPPAVPIVNLPMTVGNPVICVEASLQTGMVQVFYQYGT